MTRKYWLLWSIIYLLLVVTLIVYIRTGHIEYILLWVFGYVTSLGLKAAWAGWKHKVDSLWLFGVIVSLLGITILGWITQYLWTSG